MEPLVLAADMDLPVLDCDCMGRAFPGDAATANLTQIRCWPDWAVDKNCHAIFLCLNRCSFVHVPPELQMCTNLIYGGKPYPCALGDASGCAVVVTAVNSAKRLESVMRVVCVEMG